MPSHIGGPRKCPVKGLKRYDRPVGEAICAAPGLTALPHPSPPTDSPPRPTDAQEGRGGPRSRGTPKGKQPKRPAREQADLVRMRSSGEYSIADLMEMFSVGRATVYRVLERAGHNRVGEAT